MTREVTHEVTHRPTHRMRVLNPVRVALLGLATLVIPARDAAAQDICVVCTEPLGSYSCNVEGWSKFQRFRKAAQFAQLACIKDIAHRFGHGECRVRTNTTGPCLGTPYKVTLESSDVLARPPAVAPKPQPPGVAPRPGAPGQPNKPGQIRPGQVPKQPAKAEDAPPETVVELAKKATKDSEQQIKNAGKAVGGAMQKTWRCLTSLFKDC